jgi:hypothetical protein
MTKVSTIDRFWRRQGARAVAAAVLSVLLAAGFLAARLRPLAADTGDKKGWSVLTDPRKRAFLIFVPSAGDARLLNVACLRDVDSFTVYSEAVAGNLPAGAATLTLSNGNARYDVAGSIAPDPVSNLPTFTGNVAESKKALSDISGKLLPVLQGAGPILYEIGGRAAPNDMSKSPTSIPVTGLAAPLAKFKSVCFGS